MHDLLAPLHFESINKYWVAALAVTILASTLSVFCSHLQQPRQHRGSRLTSDLFVRAQLAFLSYGFALFISAYVQADQKFLLQLFAALGVLGLALYLIGLWVTAPASVELHEGGDKCPGNPMENCPKPLTRGARFKLVAAPILLFAPSLGLAVWLAMSVVEAKPKLDTPPVGTLVPSALAIDQVRAGGDAYRDAPSFVWDNLDHLERERAPFKDLDHMVIVLQSETTKSTYGHFCWAVSLAEDYKAEFALSTRAAYLVHAGVPRTFTDLNFRGQGQPYVSFVAEVPKSADGDKVLMVMSIYAKSRANKVLHEVSRMLQPEVSCR